MNLTQFLNAIKRQKPLICIQGDIFLTPADHIVFAVNYPSKDGKWNNTGGFAGDVVARGWTNLPEIKFEKGQTISKKIFGKTYHAIAVHSNEEYGWDEAPDLIQLCLDKLPVNSTSVMAIVLIGGGKAGEKYVASIKNVEGISRTYKTVVLYVKEVEHYKYLLAAGYVSAVVDVPRTFKLRDDYFLTEERTATSA
ncbi:MAG: hypothetical protein NTZ44_00605 [Candidatus Nomurabacteria bacterium]|nr:hypothetical protein [Candidatus Nomurabacteria bacterium]